MSEEEKKENLTSGINYRTDHAERELARHKKSANEDVNKSKKRGLAEIGDATGGEVKTQEQIRKEGGDRKGKNFVDRVGKKEPIYSRERIKEPHLNSTSSLTDPDAVKQNLKDISNRGKSLPENSTFRGGSNGRSGGVGGGLFKEPDEILKEKNDALDPKDLLSQKHNGKQQKQETQQQQAQDKSKNPQSLGMQKLSVRERTDIAKAAKEKVTSKAGTIDKANVSERVSIKERIAQAIARKEATPEKASVVKEKNKELAMNKAKQVSSKTIKR